MTRRDRFDRSMAGTFAVAVAVLLALMFVPPPGARAASETYPGGNATTFATGAGGWTSTEDYDGLCVQSVTCPAVAGEFRATGGAEGVGDGFIRSTAGPTSVAALLSTSVQVWNGPAFTYRGVSGAKPASLTFSLFKRSGYQELIQAGATANYSVTAVNESGGANRVLLEKGTVGINEEWERAAREAILADSLKVGDEYSIQIRTEVGDLAAILPGGQVDYDNVSLVASDGAGNGNGGNGNNGGNGAKGADGTGAFPPPKVIPAGVAYLYRGKLFVRVKCPKRFKPKCKVRAVVKTKRRKGKAITRQIRTKVKSKRFKSRALKVKPRYRKRMLRLSKVNQKTVTLKLRIKSRRGKKKGTVFHQLKVRRNLNR